jgi:hypothetical protein
MSDAANRKRDRDKTQMFQSQTQSTPGGESRDDEKAAPPPTSFYAFTAGPNDQSALNGPTHNRGDNHARLL